MSQIKKLLIIIGSVLIFLPLLFYFPHKGAGDMEIWLEWMSHIQMWGPLNAYGFINARPDFWTVQPPLYFINLWLAIKASNLFNVSSIIGVKAMLLFFYLLTLVSLVYFSKILTKRSIWKSFYISFILFFGGIYFVIISMVFTTLDITFAPFVVFSLSFFARRNYFLSGIFFAVAFLIKWINIVLIPVFLFYLVFKKIGDLKIDNRSTYFISGTIFIISILVGSFLFNDLSLVSIYQSLVKSFRNGMVVDTGGALNFWHFVDLGVLKLLYPETYAYLIKNNLMRIWSPISSLIFSAAIIVILKSSIKKDNSFVNFLHSGILVSWSYFIWKTGVHANHLYLTVLLALCLAIVQTNKKNIVLYAWLCFFGLSPVLTHGFPISSGFIETFGYSFWLLVLLSVLNIAVYACYLFNYLRNVK